MPCHVYYELVVSFEKSFCFFNFLLVCITYIVSSIIYKVCCRGSHLTFKEGQRKAMVWSNGSNRFKISLFSRCSYVQDRPIRCSCQRPFIPDQCSRLSADCFFFFFARPIDICSRMDLPLWLPIENLCSTLTLMQQVNKVVWYQMNLHDQPIFPT